MKKALEKWQQIANAFPFTEEISAVYVQVAEPQVSLKTKAYKNINIIVK